MAKFDKQAVMAKMGAASMVPVFYNKDVEVTKQVIKACYDGGVRAFEFTNRGDFAHTVFAEVISFVRSECPEMAMGAGTVLDAPTAVLYMQYGADFIVAPNFNPEVAKVCNRRGVSYSPGCGTVTEIGFAQEAGADLIKVFPGDVLGPRFIKDVLGPLPWSKLMVTGGVAPEKENLEAWFKAGVYSVGMGSKLFPKDKVAAGDWAYITEKCREALSIISEVSK